jgi:hypothetical protein
MVPAGVILVRSPVRRLLVITIGIDPHKLSHTAVALDEAGRSAV